MRHIVLFYLTALLFISTVNAQDYTAGDVVADFRLREVATDSVVRLKDLTQKKAVVLVFFTNDCPYSTLYLDRIKKLHRKFQPNNIQFLLINSADPDKAPSESVKAMEEIKDSLSIPVPYLADKRGSVAIDYRVQRVPEVFLLTPKNDNFVLRYRGAIDDNPQLPEDTRNDYLQEALSAIVNGQPLPKNYIRSVGCKLK